MMPRLERKKKNGTAVIKKDELMSLEPFTTHSEACSASFKNPHFKVESK